jgi:hypothetical protein
MKAVKGLHLSLVAALLVPGHAWGLDPATLQKELASAKDLAVINRVSDLPPDALSKLDHIPWLQGLRLADFGAQWGVGDAPAPGLPLGQHLFSGVSDRLVAVVFFTNAHSAQVRLLLAHRNDPEYCLFDLQLAQVGGLSLENVQWLARSGQRAAADAAPTCSKQTTREEFRTSP